MKHIGNELFSIIEQKKLVKKEIAKQIGITPVYLSAIMKKDSIDAELLEKICKAINISPAYFFDDYTENKDITPTITHVSASNSPMANISQIEVDMLKSMLEEKERTIKILMQAKGINSSL